MGQLSLLEFEARLPGDKDTMSAVLASRQRWVPLHMPASCTRVVSTLLRCLTLRFLAFAPSAVITLTDDDYTNGWVLGEEYGANGYNYQQPRKESASNSGSDGGSFVWIDGEDDDIAEDRTIEKLYERDGTATTTSTATAAVGPSPSPPSSSLRSASSSSGVQQAHLRGTSARTSASTSKDSEEQRRQEEEQLRLHQDIILGSSGGPHWIGQQDHADDDWDDIIPFFNIVVNEDYEAFGLAGEDGERLQRGQRQGLLDSRVPSVALVALALAAATLACALFVVSLTTVAVLRAWRASAMGRARLSGSENAAEPLLV